MQIDLSTLAVSHIMPGGTAFGAALMYRLLTRRQGRPSDAGFAIAMQGVSSAVVLNVIFWVALAPTSSTPSGVPGRASRCSTLR
jgi:uncharacterized membrane protein YbhN (UPF0104 family)